MGELGTSGSLLLRAVAGALRLLGGENAPTVPLTPLVLVVGVWVGSVRGWWNK